MPSLWAGQPMTARWGVPDPVAAGGAPEQIERAFRDAFTLLDRRISRFLSLSFSSLDRLAIQKEIQMVHAARHETVLPTNIVRDQLRF
jgi:arsenate reductase (thioredoxin)